ncbi:MAG: VOC family protein [Anaerolineae bacterium]|nr:VOC family protein [Anaerolineae bacterium]
MPDYHTKLGHAHLKVRDLARSIAFYTRYFNLRVIEQIGDQYAFLSGGAFHHEIALQARGLNAPQPHPYSVGLYHIAFEVPDARSFALAYQQLQQDGIEVGAVDHQISWAMYFNDPDGNGLEIYWDTRREPHGTPTWNGENRRITADQLEAALRT